MGPDVERFFSPDGQRILMLDHLSGDVWIARRLSKGEAADAISVLPSWVASRTASHPPEHQRWHGALLDERADTGS
jgi:hypothetical protein